MVRILPVHAALLAVAVLSLPASSGRAGAPRLLPADTQIVLKVNFKPLLESELLKGKRDDIKAFVQAHPLGAELMKLLKQMNFDPFTQLTSITLCHNGNESLRPGDGFAVIEGAFDVKKFHEVATVVVETFPETVRLCYRFRGVPVYEFEFFDKMVFCALVNNTSIVLAPNERALKAAMTRAAGDKVEAGKVAPLLKAAKDTQIVNLAATGEAAARLVRLVRPSGIPGIDLADIRSVTGGMTLTKDLKFHATVAAKDARAAKDMADVGTFGLFALRTLAGDAGKDPNLAPLIEVMATMRVVAQGDNVVLTGTATPQNIERLYKWLAK